MKRSAVAAGAVAAGAALALAGAGAYGQGKKWYPFSVEEHNPPFDMASPVKDVMYSPLEKAEKKEIERLREAAKREQLNAQYAQAHAAASSHEYNRERRHHEYSAGVALVDLLSMIWR